MTDWMPEDDQDRADYASLATVLAKLNPAARRLFDTATRGDAATSGMRPSPTVTAARLIEEALLARIVYDITGTDR